MDEGKGKNASGARCPRCAQKLETKPKASAEVSGHYLWPQLPFASNVIYIIVTPKLPESSFARLPS